MENMLRIVCCLHTKNAIIQNNPSWVVFKPTPRLKRVSGYFDSKQKTNINWVKMKSLYPRKNSFGPKSKPKNITHMSNLRIEFKK